MYRNLIPAYTIHNKTLPVTSPMFCKLSMVTKLKLTKGKTESVRLIGVDTPETVHPNKPVEFFGKEVSAFLKNLLTGEKVCLRIGNEE